MAVASDIGPILNPAKYIDQKMPKRKQSKSVDEIELAQVHRSIEQDKKNSLSPKVASNQRRRSKDDHDLPEKTDPKDSHYYLVQQKSLRKRFGRLFGNLQGRRPPKKQLEPTVAPTPSPTSDVETLDDKTSDKSPEKSTNSDESSANDMSKTRPLTNESKSQTNYEQNNRKPKE